jgi:neutral ceramidase
MEALRVGHGRVCITPPGPVRMMGYAGRTELSRGVHDDLFANAVALESGDRRVLILALDVCSLNLDGVTELKAAIGERTGLSPEQILINTSHTHAGPLVARRPGAEFDEIYFGMMTARAVEAVVAALADLAPATLAVGSAAVEIGWNRRERTPEGEIILGVNPEGPSLPEVTLWCFDRGVRAGGREREAIVLFSLPIHGTTMGADNLYLSAEWMGAAVRHIENADTGVRAVFLQGCSGNQNPYRDERTFERMAQHGTAVGEAVIEALASAETVSSWPLINLVRTIEIPYAEGQGRGVCPLHALRIGDTVLIGLGGEVFIEYALYGRERSTAVSTMILGYTDGSVGYLPTAIAYEEGGYEPNAYQHLPNGKPWAPEIEELLKAEIDAVLSDLLAP